MKHLALLGTVFLASAFVAGCGTAQAPAIEKAIVHLPLAEGRPGVSYFTVKGGPADARLVSASSPQVIRIELHDNVMENGVMKMVPLASGVAIPAGGTVAFQPGGKHAMLFDINPTLKNGDTLAMTFAYADGSKIETRAKITARGEAAGHDH